MTLVSITENNGTIKRNEKQNYSPNDACIFVYQSMIEEKGEKKTFKGPIL